MFCNRLCFVLLIAVSLAHNGGAFLRCYTCTSQGQGTGCELNPSAVPGGITNCNKRYCTMRRIEFKASNQVQSFYRSCEDNPMYVNKIVEDDTYRTFFQACATELCNSGTGRESYIPDGNGHLPPGVTIPPFNDRVLHAFSTASVLGKLQFSVLLVTTAISIYYASL